MQTTHHRLRHRIPAIKLYAQELKLWVLQLVAWVAGWAEGVLPPEEMRELRAWLREDMAHARKRIREVLFILIVAHATSGRRGKFTTRPFKAPPGFRRVARDIDLLRVYLRGIPLKTLDQMRHALDHLDATIARAVKRAPNSVALYRITCVAAPTIAPIAAEPAHAPAAADTS